MFNIDVSKYRISINDYSYKEFEKNKKVALRVSELRAYLSIFIGTIFLRSILHLNFLLIFVFMLVFGFVVRFISYDEELKCLKNKYFSGAKREWRIVSKTELFPRFDIPIDYNKLNDFGYYESVKRYRYDAVIKNKRIEYYVPVNEKGNKRRSLLVSDVYFDTISDERSFLICEKWTFVDNRFLLLEEKYPSHFLSFRYMIQSKYIQW